MNPAANPAPEPDPPGPVCAGATEEVRACPACEGAGHRFLRWGRSYYREEWFRYRLCPDCGLVFVSPRLPASAVESRVETGEGAERKFLAAAPFEIAEAERDMVAPVSRLLPPLRPDGSRRTWLDAGCAVGNLLAAAASRGYAVRGLELNRGMAEWAARHRPELGIVQGLMDALPAGETYGVVSADNVLEHLHDPAGFLRDCRARLEPGGVLAIRVPNYNTAARPVLAALGRLPRSYITDPDAHPCNYSRRPLLALLARSGFRPLRVMEHVMPAYPLKHILGRRAAGWGPVRRAAAFALFRLSFLAGRIVPLGGIDITVIATPKG